MKHLTIIKSFRRIAGTYGVRRWTWGAPTALALIAALVLGLSPLALAQQAPAAAPSTAQVEQLQAQLAEMQKEMDAMRKALEASNDIPVERRQMMQQHMGRMQQQWQGMHHSCCMMAPGTCAHR